MVYGKEINDIILKLLQGAPLHHPKYNLADVEILILRVFTISFNCPQMRKAIDCIVITKYNSVGECDFLAHLQ